MKSIQNFLKAKTMNNTKFAERIKFGDKDDYVYQKSRRKRYKVTIIMPIHNSGTTMSKSIESVRRQSIGFDHIELILVDDGSEDRSKVIALDYADLYKNITLCFLKHNSGTPAKPRNKGIHLAKGDYMMFLDADDWLHETGVESLYHLLERTGNHYAVGKTIKLTDKKTSIIGEYNSWITREFINPFDIKQSFYHLAPAGRMMRTSFVQNSELLFPEMKYAEDKLFFIDVLTTCGYISTSKDVIYYANRYRTNTSLTGSTSVFEKTDANIASVHHVIQKQLPVEQEKMILKRIYEFDCITRLFDREHFLKSYYKNKYFSKFQQVMDTASFLRYDIKEIIHQPLHQLFIDLFREGHYDDLVALIKWSKREKIKDFRIVDSLPYYVIPLEDGDHLVRMNILAVYHDAVKQDSCYTVYFKIYGDVWDRIDALTVKERHNDFYQKVFPVHRKEGNIYYSDIPYEQLIQLDDSSYSLFLKYDGYKKLPIKMNTRGRMNYQEKRLDFYTTLHDNLGFKIE